MRRFFAVFFVFLFICLTSCATKISTSVVRPAELNLNGAKTLAVLPFRTNPWNNDAIDILDFFLTPFNESVDKIRICDDITQQLTMGFLNADYMQMVSANKVKSAIESGREIPCDVYLSGYINYYDERITRNEYEYDDEITIEYSRSISLSILYEVIDAKTNRIISYKTSSINRTSASEKSKRDLPSGYDVVRYELRSLANEIFRQIQPYTVIVTFKLLKDKTKNPKIQAAHEMAKNRNLREAKDLFLEAYKETGLFECAYNAAIILEAMQRYDEAEKMMTKLYKKTYDKRAEKALQSIRYEKRSAEKLNAQNAAREESDYDDDDDDFDFFDDDDDDFDW